MKSGKDIRTFAHSFTPVVNLKRGETCSLKRHYRGALHELIGYLDLLAQKDPERFVFAHMDTIISACSKFKSKKPFRERAIKYALAELRLRFIVSKRLMRSRFGREMEGFIVAPHDSLALQHDHQCRLRGQALGGPSVWARTEGGVVFWAGWNVNSISCVPESALTSAPNCAPQSALESAPNCALHTSGQTTEDETTSPQKSALSLVNHSSLVAELTDVTVDEAAKSGGQSTFGASSLPKSMNEKTIGQHFGVPWPQSDFKLITDQVLNADTKQWEAFGYEAERKLLEFCSDVIRELAAECYLGRKTNARIMNIAQERYNGAHGRVPKSWVKVMNDLRRG